MRKLIFVLSLTFLFMFVLAACGSNTDDNAVNNNGSAQQNEQPPSSEENTEAVEPETGEEAEPQEGTGNGTGGFLWKTTHNGNIVYMLGSIHVATEDFYPLHEKIEAAFAESDVLAVEADIVHGDLMEQQQMMDQLAKYDDGTTLADHLPADVYEKLEGAFEQYGVPLELFNGYEPWYVQMLLENFQIMEQGYDPTLGIDYHFLENAGQNGTQIIELEGVQFQLDLFDQLSPEIQLKLIESTLEADPKEQEEGMKQLVEYWKLGDEEGMSEILLASEEDSPEMEQYMKILMDDRNVGMADKIEQFLQSDEQKTYFVVVGAAHYIGDGSIISILKERGYDIEKEIETP